MEYEAVIGLEIHARISSKTKMFCRCRNDFFDLPPNSAVCPVCMGFPGMLPLPNREAILKGVKAALALECQVPEFSKFDRKSYFYPDLPKGFQISQYDQPVSHKGRVTIQLEDGSEKEIGITRLHLEDDAGKLTHEGGGSRVDFNRSGSPLMEIVSEPDMRNAAEASAYARQIQKILRYVDASDADMEKGQMRFDINVSLRPKGQKAFGVKAEVKNLNSFRSLEKALEYEIARQTGVLKNNGQVVQETRGWDDAKEVTVSQRSKEEAADYRYFPEPDIPPLFITRETIAALKKEIPELPEAKAARYRESLSLPPEIAGQLAASAAIAAYFEAALAVSKEPRRTANWLLSELMGLLNARGLTIAESALQPARLGALVSLIESGAVTGKIAKDHFEEIYANDADPDAYFESRGLKAVNDAGTISAACQTAINNNAPMAAAFMAGKEKALGALVGQVMAATKGAADPKLVNQILRELLAGGQSPPGGP